MARRGGFYLFICEKYKNLFQGIFEVDGNANGAYRECDFIMVKIDSAHIYNCYAETSMTTPEFTSMMLKPL